MIDLILGGALTLFFLALMVSALATGTMPSMVPTVDSASKDDAPAWFWALGFLNVAGLIVGVVLVIRGLGFLSG